MRVDRPTRIPRRICFRRRPLARMHSRQRAPLEAEIHHAEFLRGDFRSRTMMDSIHFPVKTGSQEEIAPHRCVYEYAGGVGPRISGVRVMNVEASIFTIDVLCTIVPRKNIKAENDPELGSKSLAMFSTVRSRCIAPLLCTETPTVYL
jgi:hypothetical protein